MKWMVFERSYTSCSIVVFLLLGDHGNLNCMSRRHRHICIRDSDMSDVLLVDHNTSANTARFEYSTNSGVSWNSLGTIPNTVGTLVRYTFATPPGVDIRPSLKEL